MPTIPLHPLPSGARMPAIGLGTYGISGPAAAATVAHSIRSGYRLLDTAAAYENEAEIGEGMRSSGTPRSELFLTTKIRRRTEHAAAAVASIQASLARLKLDRIDLLLLHGPNASREHALDAWRGLIDARDAGLVTDIGVSNFSPQQIQQLHAATGHWPAVSQVQLSPALQRSEDVEFYQDTGILPMAWSPLGIAHGVLDNPTVREIARSRGVSPAVVVIRWGLQRGHVVIPKSGSLERQRENLGALMIELSDPEMAALGALDTATQTEWEAANRLAW